MSFGYYDKDWVEPDPEPIYRGVCGDCRKFNECPCGCGWGWCDDDRCEFLDGGTDSCECGEPL